MVRPHTMQKLQMIQHLSVVQVSGGIGVIVTGRIGVIVIVLENCQV